MALRVPRDVRVERPTVGAQDPSTDSDAGDGGASQEIASALKVLHRETSLIGGLELGGIMQFARRIGDNVVSAVVASVIIAVAVFAWDFMKNGALISALHGVTKTELDHRLEKIGNPDLSVLNDRMTLQCTWEPVGRPKSIHKDKGDWCPEGHLVRQFDLDEKDSTHVADALCCKLVFK